MRLAAVGVSFRARLVFHTCTRIRLSAWQARIPLRKCVGLWEPFQIFILYRGLNYYACNSKLLVGVTENLFLTVSTLRHTGATLLYRVPLHYCLSIRTVLLVLSLVWV